MTVSDDALPPDNGKRSELADGLASLREDAGLPPAEKQQLEAPFVSVSLPIDDLAIRVADLLKASDGRWGLYRSGDDIVTVAESEGARKDMTARSFRTWLPTVRGVMPVARWVDTDERDDQGRAIKRPIKGELTKDQAETILASEVLRSKLPVLRGIHTVRLPVMDDELDERGLRKMRLLETGFDPGTGIYTTRGGLDYDTSVPFDDAVNYFWNLFRHFGWRTPNRDFAIHLTAILTMYGRGIYLGKAPAFVYNANMQESGKTTLASYVAWLVHGHAATRPLLKDSEAKLEELLNTAALHGNPYVFFDNVDWGSDPVKTVLLDEWLTNSRKSFRKLGGNQEAAPELRALTMMTGNRMTLSTDLQRRSLMVDLLNRLSGSERELPSGVTIIDSGFFNNAEHRKLGLACCWSIFKEWDIDGRPQRPGKLLGSFEQWSAIMPSVVYFAGQKAGGQVWDCMAESVNEDIGDKDSLEYKKLAEMALMEFGPDEAGTMRDTLEITVAQFAGVARRNAVATRSLWPEQDVESVMQSEGKPGGWKCTMITPAPRQVEDFAELVEAQEDDGGRKRSASEWLSPKTRSSFGNALKVRMHERYFRGPDGELYEFMHRRQVVPARYQITRVKR